MSKRILFFILSFLLLFFQTQELQAQKKNKKNKNRKVVESTGDVYDLNIHYAELNFTVLDYESAKEIKKGEVEIIQTETGNFPDTRKESINKGSASLKLPLLDYYTIKVSAQDYTDTTFNVDLKKITEYSFSLQIFLKPTFMDYEIQISDIDTDSKNPIRIILTNKRNNEQVVLDNKNKNGKYSVKIRSEDEYQLEIQNAQRYTFFKGIINGKNNTETLKVKYIELGINSKIALKDITFETGVNTLNQHSKQELDRIVLMLKETQTMELEIRGHTDNVGDPSYNLILSQQRAESVKEYLVQKGIDPSRLKAKGYGLTQPLVDNDTEEHRAMNRRFELIITGL